MTGVVEDKMDVLGITLPELTDPIGDYKRCRRSGNTLFLSGHYPMAMDGTLSIGQVGPDIPSQIAETAARLCAIQLIATMKDATGDLDKIRMLKITGFVDSGEGFNRQDAVVDGASKLLLEVFGEDKGAHARSAVGMCGLPMGCCVEIEAIAEVEP